MAETGERIITQADPRTAPQDGQWVGHWTADPQQRRWHARHIERCIERMDTDLGAVPEANYQIVEGGTG